MKSLFEIKTSPLISITSGKSFDFISFGISFTVFKFSVISSPSIPFPLERPVAKIPFLYIGRPHWYTELNYLKLDSLILASVAPSVKLILPETKHFDYSDTPQFSPMARKIGVTGTMPADAIRDTLNTRILHFFTKYLGQD